MRRWRRGYRNRYDEYSGYNDILLAEFRFYNKKKKLIDDSILAQIYSRVVEGETVYWTNPEFASCSVGFKMFKREEEIYIRIMELKVGFSAKQFNSCKEIVGGKLFIGYDMKEKEKGILDEIDSDYIRVNGRVKKTILNWTEMVDFFVENKVLDNYDDIDDGEDELRGFNDDLKLMFNIEVKVPKYHKINERYTSSEAHHIMEVIERRINDVNYRIAVIAQFSGYSVKYIMKTVPEDDADYNYIDKGRLYVATGRGKYFLDTTLTEFTEKGEVKINVDLFKLMANNIADVLGERKEITPAVYRFYADRVMKFDDYDYRGTLDAKQMAIMEQYKKIMATGRDVKIDHTTIGGDIIRVDGENFEMKFDKNFLDIEERLPNILHLIREQDVRYNFNALYEGLLGMSCLKVVHMDRIHNREYKEFERATFTLNGMQINVSKDKNRVKINGIFCRINDVFQILSKAICHNSIDDFNKFVKEVSHIGMEWKRMIAEGISIEIENPFNSVFRKIGKRVEERLYLRFSLLWDAEKRSIVYLVLNDKRYHIRYKGKFKYEFNSPSQTLSMARLKKKLKMAIDGITDDMIIEMVENGIKEAKIIKERGEELVKNTIKEVGAKEGEIDIRGGKIYGFQFKGRVSSSKYFVEKNNLTVYKWMDGAWNRRCVIDDGTKQRIYEDRLANRLVNIYNEPARITTIH